MKTKKIAFVFILLFSSIPCIWAQSFVYQNDTAYLCLNGHKFGHIQWQHSNDSVNWFDISGATIANYPIVPDSSSFYRARVNSGTCDPFYSQTIRIDVLCFECGDTLIDYRDQQRYPTVLIGTQCWFAKNVNTGEKINNGSQLQTDNNIIEKFCYYNDTNYCNIYGGLYTWNEVMQYSTIESSQGICPCGWHVPSDQEWIDLEIELGMDSIAASYTNTWRGTNQGQQLMDGGTSGYDALLSGRALPNGYFNILTQYEYMYTSTIFGNNAWRRCVRIGDGKVGRWNTFPQNYGLSVRCIKD